uniref:peptidylprolyl isomerase n=1 Tax=Tetradesmus obliquus TaxID=3088 RepID=A0A383V445_TETOB|eukprot:jgi/Sobl393_1/13659/SZX60375.1
MQAIRLRRGVSASAGSSRSTAARTLVTPHLARLHRRPSAPVDATANFQCRGVQQLPQALQQRQQQRQQLVRCSSSSGNSEPTTTPTPVVVVEGDIVTFHMTCADADGKILESTKDGSKENEPMAFEIGAGDIINNPLFQAFDGALRGLAVGESVELQMSGPEWQSELLFSVPRDHPEIERLEGRYKNLGGLAEGLAVELANGSMAVVVEAGPEAVKLDANSMMAGKTLLFTLEVLGIDSSN